MRLRAQRHRLEPLRSPPPAPAPAQTYAQLMALARDIERIDPRGLPALVAAILRPLQAAHLLSAAEHTPDQALDPVRLRRLFSPDDFFSPADPADCQHPPAHDYRLDPARHVILATPWQRRDLVAALAAIPTPRPDDTGPGPGPAHAHHPVTLLLPWGIGLATTGHHAIAAAVLSGAGPITPSDVVNLSPLLQRIGCDGHHYRERISGRILARVADQRLGAVYELGWLMARHGAALHPLATPSGTTTTTPA